jgi:hypothetical protein
MNVNQTQFMLFRKIKEIIYFINTKLLTGSQTYLKVSKHRPTGLHNKKSEKKWKGFGYAPMQLKNTQIHLKVIATCFFNKNSRKNN